MISLSEAYTQNAPRLISKCTQTPNKPKVNQATSYEHPHRDGNVTYEMIASMLKKVSPLIERALQDNETIDIFADYCNIPEKGDISLFYNMMEDETFKPLESFFDFKLSQGKFVQHITLHPDQEDIIATSLCNSRTTTNQCVEDTSTPSVAIWKLGRPSPLFVLKSPADCTVFHFNTHRPQFVAGGCRNGAVVFWNLSKEELREVNSNQDDTPTIQPVLICSPEHGPKGIVTDLCWLPPEIQINAKGKRIDPCHLKGTSDQFITVSADGLIAFWDIRFKEILEGKLPYVAKVKKQALEYDDDFPFVNWMPLYKIKPKQRFGSGNISFCQAFIPMFSYNEKNSVDATELLCASEEGDLTSINWSPKSSSQEEYNGENIIMKDIPPQDYVQWTRKDHNRPCINLDQSPFFPDIVLSVCDWNFHLWDVGVKANTPIFTSPTTSPFITGGKWSPTRPAVIFITKADGAIDIWDFITEGFYTPHSTIQLVTNRITSIAFRQNAEMGHLVMMGDSSGTMHIFEVPVMFAKPIPNELR
jgi:FOG: WD40 repeat